MRMSMARITTTTMITSTIMARGPRRTRISSWCCCRWPAATPAALNDAIEPAVRAFADPATVIDLPRRSCRGARALRHRHLARRAPTSRCRSREPAPTRCSASTTRSSSACTWPAQRPAAERKFASHHHEDDISSIGISDPRPLDPAKLNQWLDYLLKTRGQDIFRMKGVLNVKGEDRRQVFHGVHMMFDAQAERPWGLTPARQQPGVHRPRTGSRRVRSRLRIRRREVVRNAGKAIAVLRARAARRRCVRRLRRRLRLVAGRQVRSPIAGGEGKVGARHASRATLGLRTIGEHLLGTLAVAWQPRAQRFATSGQDGAIALWDAATATPTQALEARA